MGKVKEFVYLMVHGRPRQTEFISKNKKKVVLEMKVTRKDGTIENYISDEKGFRRVN